MTVRGSEPSVGRRCLRANDRVAGALGRRPREMTPSFLGPWTINKRRTRPRMRSVLVCNTPPAPQPLG